MMEITRIRWRTAKVLVHGRRVSPEITIGNFGNFGNWPLIII